MKQPEDWVAEVTNDPGMASDLTVLFRDIQEDATKTSQDASFRAGMEYACRHNLQFMPMPGSRADQEALAWFHNQNQQS